MSSQYITRNMTWKAFVLPTRPSFYAPVLEKKNTRKILRPAGSSSLEEVNRPETPCGRKEPKTLCTVGRLFVHLNIDVKNALVFADVVVLASGHAFDAVHFYYKKAVSDTNNQG